MTTREKREALARLLEIEDEARELRLALGLPPDATSEHTAFGRVALQIFRTEVDRERRREEDAVEETAPPSPPGAGREASTLVAELERLNQAEFRDAAPSPLVTEK